MPNDDLTQAFHVEHYPIGSCVCNAQGLNVLWFPHKPGAKFTTAENATAICARWNAEGAPSRPTPKPIELHLLAGRLVSMQVQKLVQLLDHPPDC